MRFMTVLVLITVLAWPRPVVAGPEIVGDAGKAECQIALGMAKAAFDSTNFSLEWPIFAPDAADAKVVLAGALGLGDKGVRADPAVFTDIGIGRPPRPEDIFDRQTDFLFWQREPLEGKRVVVVQWERNWRGPAYHLFVIDGRQTQTDFLAVFHEADRKSFQYIGAVSPFLVTLLGNPARHSPTVLKNLQSGGLWILDQKPFGSAAWHVYLLAAAEPAVSPCSIRLVPGDAIGLVAMPKAVRRFAALADEALGPGTGEGTLRQTDRIRGTVASAWEVMTERPWALTRAPYNSRAEVDAGLAEWARGVPSRLAVLHRLEAGYGRAERALATFYVKKFGLEPEVAARFSGYAMDFMLRSYFVFHSDDRQVRVPAVSVWPVLVR